jgi:hypothetical protein
MDFLENLLRLVRQEGITDDETPIDRKIRLMRTKLKHMKKEGKEKKSIQQEETGEMRRHFEAKQRELYGLGRKAQRNISLYDYAVMLRLSTRNEGKSDGSKLSNLRTSQRLLVNVDAMRTPDGKSESTRTLVLRSQTVYASSALLWQLIVASTMEVRLLKKTHILMMFHTQEKLCKSGLCNIVKYLSTYVTSSDKLDEASIDILTGQAKLMDQTEKLKKETSELKELYVELRKMQRRLILKLKLMEGQQVCRRSLANMKSWSSISDADEMIPLLPPPKKLKQVQELPVKNSHSHSHSPNDDEGDVPEMVNEDYQASSKNIILAEMVDEAYQASSKKIILEFSLEEGKCSQDGDQQILKDEKKSHEKRRKGKKHSKKGGNTDDEASVRSMPNNSEHKKKKKLKTKRVDTNTTDDEASVKSMPNTLARKKKKKKTETENEDTVVNTLPARRKKKKKKETENEDTEVDTRPKRTRSEIKRELVSIASSHSLVSSETSKLEGRHSRRFELEERRRKAEERLALSKQKLTPKGLQANGSVQSKDSSESGKNSDAEGSTNTQASPEIVSNFPFFQATKK